MGLVEAVKSVFGNYATFSGRARRSEYWFFYLFNLIAVFVFMIVASIIGAIFGGGKGAAGGLAVGYVLYILYGLAAFIPSLAVAVRRLHDTNRSGWNPTMVSVAVCWWYRRACVYGYGQHSGRKPVWRKS